MLRSFPEEFCRRAVYVYCAANDVARMASERVAGEPLHRDNTLPLHAF